MIKRKYARNVFCATGDGGGVDPSCSPGASPVNVVESSHDFYAAQFEVDGKHFDFHASHGDRSQGEWDVSFAVGADSIDFRKARTAPDFHEAVQKMRYGVQKDADVSPIKVLTTVGVALKQFMDDKKPAKITFSADLSEPSRVKAYDKLIPRIERATGYKAVATERRHGFKEYTLERATVENNLQLVAAFVINPFVSEAQRKACYAKDEPGWDCKEWDKHTRNSRMNRLIKVDPTRTLRASRAMSNELKRRFARLRGQIVKYFSQPSVLNAFCPTGEGGGVDPSCGKSGGGIVARITAKVKDKYAKLEQRYGSRYAKAIIGAALVGLPLPVPGASLALSAPLIAVAELHRQLTRNEEVDVELLDEAVVQREARKLLDELELTVNAPVDSAQITAFKRWLRTQIRGKLSDEQLWQRYAELGYRRGLQRSYEDARRARPTVERRSPEWELGGKETMIQASFRKPVSVERLKVLAGRSFDDMEGITDEMSTRMVRTLADGLTAGRAPAEIARDISRHTRMAESRATTVARTEIIRAHAEGQLQMMEDSGITEVGVAVEWATAGDERVCELCDSMADTVLTVEEARGMLPRHANCRCAWLPAGVGEKDKGRNLTQKQVKAAVKGAESDDDWGPAVSIGKERPVD